MSKISPTAVVDAALYFDQWLAFRQRFELVPGVQAAILHGDTLALDAAHGYADIAERTPLTPRHLFRIASHSKTFTATAIMQLVEQGALRLDDTGGQWLDFLSGTPIATVTIREMLSHAGGIVRDGWDGDFWQLAFPFPDTEQLRRISVDAAKVLDRNERFKYSNVAYSLLGLIIEEATGVAYRTYVSEHIVDRLGLADTGPELDPSRLDQYATGYTALGYGDTRIPIEHIDTGAMAAATGFYSTATDVVRYVSGHFFGDERLVSDESKRLMQRIEWKVDGTDSSYGLGFAVATIGGRRVLGHGGGYPGHITRTFFDPVDRLAVSVLTNAIDGPALAMATAAIRLVDLAQHGIDEGVPADRADLASFCGRFANLWGVFDVVRLGGRLYQVDPTTPDPALEPVHLDVVDADTLRIRKAPGYGSPGENLEYQRETDGSIRSVRGGSGSTSHPIDAFVGALLGRDRITLGAPIAPVHPAASTLES